MEKSIFTEKTKKPGQDDLAAFLGDTCPLWQIVEDYVLAKYPGGLKEWYYSGEKYGWNFRIKDKKRAILYLLPRQGFFKVAFVFGQKATDMVMQSHISDDIKKELESARKYAEGRGIRIDVRDEKIIKDIKELIGIKLSV